MFIKYISDDSDFSLSFIHPEEKSLRIWICFIHLLVDPYPVPATYFRLSFLSDERSVNSARVLDLALVLWHDSCKSPWSHYRFAPITQAESGLPMHEIISNYRGSLVFFLSSHVVCLFVLLSLFTHFSFFLSLSSPRDRLLCSRRLILFPFFLRWLTVIDNERGNTYKTALSRVTEYRKN